MEKKLAEFSEVTSKAKNAIALGYGSIYNHCDDPNLRYEAIPEEKLIRFIARRSINPNEQLTINYTHHDGIDKSVKKGWFEINQIEKLDIDN